MNKIVWNKTLSGNEYFTQKKNISCSIQKVKGQRNLWLVVIKVDGLIVDYINISGNIWETKKYCRRFLKSRGVI